MKIILTLIVAFFTIAASAQITNTFDVKLQAVDGEDLRDVAHCGYLKNVVPVSFYCQTPIKDLKAGDIIVLNIVCPEFYPRLRNIKKGKIYHLRIEYLPEKDEYGEGPGYYLDKVL